MTVTNEEVGAAMNAVVSYYKLQEGVTADPASMDYQALRSALEGFEASRAQGVYQYRAQHPRYTEGLKDDFQWTRLLGVVQEIAQEWGPDAWIERRFVGPIERVQDSETPAEEGLR